MYIFLFASIEKYGIKKGQLIYVFTENLLRGTFMDNLSQVLKSVSQPAKSKAASNKKRKWREIEELRDKFQLEKELKVYEDSLEHMLEEF
jgi:hypothetical protein